MRPCSVRHHRIAIIVALAGLACAAPAAAFEGTVTQRVVAITPDGLRALLGDQVDAAAAFAMPEAKLVQAIRDAAPGVQQVISTIQVKGRMFRVDMKVNGQPASLLVDSASNRTLILLPEARQYVEWTAADRAAMAKQLADEQAKSGVKPTPFPQPSLKALGRTGRINGELSEEFEAREDERVSIGWVSKAHPELLQALRDAAKAQQGPRPTRPSPMEVFAERGLPMLVKTFENGRYEQTDLARIVPGPLSDALFAIPEGYTRGVVGTPTPAAAAAATPAAP